MGEDPKLCKCGKRRSCLVRRTTPMFVEPRIGQAEPAPQATGDFTSAATIIVAGTGYGDWPEIPMQHRRARLPAVPRPIDKINRSGILDRPLHNEIGALPGRIRTPVRRHAVGATRLAASHRRWEAAP